MKRGTIVSCIQSLVRGLLGGVVRDLVEWRGMFELSGFYFTCRLFTLIFHVLKTGSRLPGVNASANASSGFHQSTTSFSDQAPQSSSTPAETSDTDGAEGKRKREYIAPAENNL